MKKLTLAYRRAPLASLLVAGLALAIPACSQHSGGGDERAGGPRLGSEVPGRAAEPGAIPALGAWAWMNPPQSTDTLRGIWAAGPGNVWIAGDGGRVLRWNGSALATVRRGGADESLYAVWATGDEAWIGGMQGGRAVLLHVEGDAIRTVDAGGIPVAIWGASASDVYAIVDRGGRGAIVHWDGSSWSAPLPLLRSDGTPDGAVVLRDLVGDDSGRVFAVGAAGTIYRLVATATGRTFARETRAAGASLPDPFAADVHFLGVTAVRGSALVQASFLAPDGFGVATLESWQPAKGWQVWKRGLDLDATGARIERAPNAVAPCASAMLAALPSGPLRRGHLFGGEVDRRAALASLAVLDELPSACISGRNADLTWYVDAGDARMRVGASAPVVALGVAFDGQRSLAVGRHGAFVTLASEGVRFADVQPGVTHASMFSVAAASASEAWAAGTTSTTSGELLHFHDGFWASVPGVKDVRSVSAKEGSVWTAGTARVAEKERGTQGTIVRGDGVTFRTMDVPQCDSLSFVAAVGRDEAWAFGEGSPYGWAIGSPCLVHVVGDRVTRVEAPSDYLASAATEPHVESARIVVAAPNEVYFSLLRYESFGVRSARVLRWDGGALAELHVANGDGFTGPAGDRRAPSIALRGPRDLVLGGATPLRFDGLAWAPLAALADVTPDALVAPDATTLLAAVPTKTGSAVRILDAAGTRSLLETSTRLRALSRAPDGAVWAVGEDGATVRAAR